jgi:hypothetical protein
MTQSVSGAPFGLSDDCEAVPGSCSAVGEEWHGDAEGQARSLGAHAEVAWQ